MTLLEAQRERNYDELAALVRRFAPIDGEHRTAISSLSMFRYSAPTRPECSLARPAMILAAQGAKRVSVGGREYEYDRGRALLASVDLPARSRVTLASRDAPYLCVVLGLDLRRVAELVARHAIAATSVATSGHAIAVHAVSDALLDATVRLARLLETPRDIPLLAPLVEQEILIRLLQGEQGARLLQLVAADSQSNKVARAIDWLRDHYAEPLRIDALAQRVNMSASSLHHHFKDVTSLSPLQYQKQLRLHEARNLLVAQRCDVGTAARRVGYESAAQFSREYARHFGAPPSQDSLRLRRGAVDEGEAVVVR